MSYIGRTLPVEIMFGKLREKIVHALFLFG